MPNKSQIRPETLQKQQQMFDEIFKDHNEELYSTHDIQLQIWEKSGQISECMRKENTDEIITYLPGLYGWLMALWNRLEIDISEAAWSKYPNICGYCKREKKCLCISEELVFSSSDGSLNIFRRDTKDMPQSLSEWLEMFKRIYGNINKIKSLSAVWSHFQEEVGEMSREMRHRNLQELRDESADTFAWFLAFCIKLNVDIETLVWETFPFECNVCRNQKCNCPYY